MISVLESVLPIIIDVLLVVLITVSIILVIKCIYIMDRAKNVIDNVEEKVNSLNGLFKVVTLVNNKMESIVEALANLGQNIIEKVNKKKKEDDFDE